MRDPAGMGRDRGAGQRRLGLGSRRVVLAAFGISAALHLLLILVYPFLMRPDEAQPTPFPLPALPELRSGMEVVILTQVAPDEDPERPEDPEELEAIAPAPVAPTTPDLEGIEGPILIAPGPTAVERLRPDLRDERVWAPLARETVELSLEQRLDLDLAARILQFQDSVEAAIAAGEAASDWTYTDSEGKRWGVSPGQIHLGDITLPLPFNFGTSPGKLEEQRALLAVWESMQRQAARAVIEDSWKNRAQAIRARRDRERARADTIGGAR